MLLVNGTKQKTAKSNLIFLLRKLLRRFEMEIKKIKKYDKKDFKIAN